MFKNVVIVLGPILGMVLLLALLLPKEDAHGDRPLLKINISSDDDEADRDDADEHDEISRLEAAIEAEIDEKMADKFERKLEKAIAKGKAIEEATRNLDFNFHIDVDDDDDNDHDRDHDEDHDKERGGFAAELGSGKVLLVAGTSQNTTRECTGETKVAVLGNSNHVTLKGRCGAVAATGNSNVVKVEQAEKVAVIGNSNVVKTNLVNQVYFRGNANRVDYKGTISGEGKPELDSAGNNNVLARQ